MYPKHLTVLIIKFASTTYDFSLPALRRIHDYVFNSKQQTRIGNSYSNWLIIFGVSQGSISGPLLFADI